MNIKLEKPLIPYVGWTIGEDNSTTSFDPNDLVLHVEPEQKKGTITGTVLRERMKGKGVSAAILDYLLKHTKLIPEEWKGKYVFFWGTIYRNSDGNLYVRYLYWNDSRWNWGYDWLARGFYGNCPAALSARSTQPLKSGNSLKLSTLSPDAVELDHEQRIARIEAILSNFNLDV